MAKFDNLFKNIPPAGRPKPEVKTEAIGKTATPNRAIRAPRKAVNTAGARARATQGAKQQVKRKQNLKRGGLTEDERLREQNG